MLGEKSPRPIRYRARSPDIVIESCLDRVRGFAAMSRSVARPFFMVLPGFLRVIGICLPTAPALPLEFIMTYEL